MTQCALLGNPSFNSLGQRPAWAFDVAHSAQIKWLCALSRLWDQIERRLVLSGYLHSSPSPGRLCL